MIHAKERGFLLEMVMRRKLSYEGPEVKPAPVFLYTLFGKEK